MLEKQVKKDMMEAKKLKDQEKNLALSLLLADLQNEAKAKKRELTEAEEIAIVKRADKTWKQSAEGAREANRHDELAKYNYRDKVVKVYLPTEMTDDEVMAIIVECADEVGTEVRNLMPRVQKKVAGKKNGKVVAEMVKTFIKQQ